MRTSQLIRTVLLFLSLGALALGQGEARAQVTIKVRELRDNLDAHLHEIRTVEGFVRWYVDIGSQTMNAYNLQDDYGHWVQVRTAETPPRPDTRVRVTGVVAVDRGGDPYVQTESLEVVDQPDKPASTADSDRDGVADLEDACPNTAADASVDQFGCALGVGPDWATIMLYGGIGAVAIAFLVLVGALVVRSRRQTQWAAATGGAGLMGTASPVSPGAPGTASAGSAATPSAEPDVTQPGRRQEKEGEEFRGKTIKFVRPPKGTLELLPGRLEVVGGHDRGEEIRFMKTSDGVPEITFGRSEGPPYRHVELRAPTVSRRHAKMRLENGHWVITNFSDTNPVVVNGQELEEGGGERVLADGDQIEMGEVTFRFKVS